MNGNDAGRGPGDPSQPKLSRFRDSATPTKNLRQKHTEKLGRKYFYEPLRMLLRAAQVAVPSQPFLERFRDYRCKVCMPCPRFCWKQRNKHYALFNPSVKCVHVDILVFLFVPPLKRLVQLRWGCEEEKTTGSRRGFVSFLHQKTLPIRNFVLRIILVDRIHNVKTNTPFEFWPNSSRWDHFWCYHLLEPIKQ